MVAVAVAGSEHGALPPTNPAREHHQQSYVHAATQSKAPLAEIQAISFGLVNPRHMRLQCADIITKSTVNSKGKPPLGSINSPALGALDNFSVTHCCNIVGCKCTWPFGLIELAYPVYNRLFLNDYILKILNCVCPWCARVLVDESNVKLQLKVQAGLQRRDRIAFISKLCKSVNVCSTLPGAQRKKRKAKANAKSKGRARSEPVDADVDDEMADDAAALDDGDGNDEQCDDDEDGDAEDDDKTIREFEEVDEERERVRQEIHEDEQIAQARESAEQRAALLAAGCCGGVQFHYIKRGLNIWRQAKVSSDDGDIVEGKKEVMTRAMVLDVFMRMSDADIALLGLHTEKGRPEFMLFQVFVVPGRILRPVMSYQSGHQKTGDNPYTKKLQTIVDANQDAVMARCELIRRCRQSRGAHGAVITPDMFATGTTEDKDVTTNKTRSTVTAVLRAHQANKKLEQQKLQSVRRVELHGDKLQIVGNYRSCDPEIDNNTWEQYLQDDLESYQDTQWLVEDLQYLIDTYLTSDDVPVPKNSKNNRSKANAANKVNMKNKINGKCGMQRQWLLPKKNDFCARAVINPNPHLDVHELGVPQCIARIITMTETVSPLNIEKMRELIRAGPASYPGALYVQEASDVEDYTNLNYVDRFAFAETLLTDGMIVHRFIVDGDIVCFNRQPSLTKNSFMSHVVRVIRGNTFEMNPAACKAYNADFDGDQMHIHVLQTMGARVEGRRLVQIKFSILNSQSSTPLVAPIQDTLLSCFHMTEVDIIMPEAEFRRCASTATYLPAARIGRTQPALLVRRKRSPGVWRAYRTGRQLFSQLLPPTMTMVKDASYITPLGGNVCLTALTARSAPSFVKVHNDWFSNADDQQLAIINGELIRGRITSGQLGTSTSSMILHMVHNFGYEPTVRFESDIQRVSHEWLADYGFSIGPEDMVLPMPQPVNEMITRGLTAIANHPVLKPAIDPTSMLAKGDDPVVARARERAAMDMLHQLTNLVGTVAKEQVNHWNCLLQIIRSGAKGKDFNLVQILTMLGQTVVGGQRLLCKPGDVTSTTAHVPKPGTVIPSEWLKFFTLDNLTAQGHIKSSYASGLNPFEYHSHAKAGRQGIKVGALITADVGYLQRKMMYAMMNTKIENDLTVRDSAGNMLQVLYGKDGFDAEYLYRQQLPLIKMSDRELVEAYDSTHLVQDYLWQLEQQGRDEDGCMQTIEQLMELAAAEVYQLRLYRDQLRQTRLHHRSIKLEEQVEIPAHIVDIVYQAMQLQSKHQFSTLSAPVLTPSLALRRVMAFKERIYGYYPAFYNRLWDFEAALHSTLCIKNVICVYKLSYGALEHVLWELEYRFRRALADPMMDVGCIAAQNLGQVQLQGAMNSHSSVGVNKDGSAPAGGFSYFQQSIDTAEKPKDPQMRLYPVAMSRVREFMSDQEVEHHLLHGRRLSDTSDFDQQYAICEYVCKLLVKRGLDYFVKGDPSVVDRDDTRPDPDHDWLQVAKALMTAKQLEHLQSKSRYSLRFVIDLQICQALQMTPHHLVRTIKLQLKELTAQDDDVVMREAVDAYSIGLSSPTLEGGECVLRLFIAEQAKYYRSILKSTTVDGDPHRAMQLLGHHIRATARVCGVNGVHHANVIVEKYRTVDAHDGAIVKVSEPLVVTKGINLLQAVGLPFVDDKRSTANCLRQLCMLWGIEVAENTLMRNLEKMVESGEYVNSRNMLQLVKTMCHRGYIMPLQNTGINRVHDTGAIHKSNFERQIENFCEAAAFGETDALNGVTERCMLGIRIKAGTGAVDVELPNVEPSDEVLLAHKAHLASSVLPVLTRMDRDIMIHNSGEQRVYRPMDRFIDPEQMHHDMESDQVRFSSIGDYELTPSCSSVAVTTPTDDLAEPASMSEMKDKFWQEVQQRRQQYMDALKAQMAQLAARSTNKKATAKRKRDKLDKQPGAQERKRKRAGPEIVFELVTPIPSRMRVRPLDERDRSCMCEPELFQFTNLLRR